MNVRSIYDKEESLLRAKSDLTPIKDFSMKALVYMINPSKSPNFESKVI